MERREYPRVAVNFNAALVNDVTLPIGCRVRNVSTGGMMLSHEVSDSILPIFSSENLAIRFSLRKEDKRKVIQLPVAVARETDDIIGARFWKPQPGLLALVEPYRVAVPDGALAAAEEMSIPELPLPGADYGRLRDWLAAAIETVKQHPRIASAGLLTAIAAATFWLTTSRFEALEDRTGMLESSVARLNKESVKIPIADQLAVRQLDKIHEQLTSLTAQNASLDRRVGDLESAPRVVMPAAQPAPSTQVDAKTPRVVAVAPTPAPATGNETWTINLLTLYNEQAAKSFTARAQSLGIPAESKPETVGGDRVWRVQVTGFASRNEASTYSVDARRKLDLGSVWIHRAAGPN